MNGKRANAKECASMRKQTRYIVAGALFFKPPLRRRGGLKFWPKQATQRRLRQAKRAQSVLGAGILLGAGCWVLGAGCLNILLKQLKLVT